MPPAPETASPALNLVLQGWDHMAKQRPLAAWASWQRALRAEPDHKAATQALDTLAATGNLPVAARREYRFLAPADEPTRLRWDAALRGANLDDLAVAAAVFGALADADLADGRARINQAYCLAWQGDNLRSLEALDQAVRALAESAPELAIPAWALGEILRQGAGAESVADDLNHAATFQWEPGTGSDPAAFLDETPEIVPRPVPLDPAVTDAPVPDARVYEWLDAPPTEGPEAGARRVLARVIRRPGSIRLSGANLAGLDQALERIPTDARRRMGHPQREATPLHLVFLDAAVWEVRLPSGLEPGAEGSVSREAAERYFEGPWLHTPRHGLDGLTPIAAGRLAAGGDLVLRARLAAVIGFREQLADRPAAVRLYQGYPFDRLRRRLGLGTPDPAVVDPADLSSMGSAELDALDPAGLEDVPLAVAYESAAMLGDDDRTARFASVLAGRDPKALAGLDVPALFATLVRHHLGADDAPGALRHLDRAEVVDQGIHGGRDRRTFRTWRAEVLARVGLPDEAVRAYDDALAALPEADAAVAALDAAETLLDNGHDDHAAHLARRARISATRAGDRLLADRAAVLVPGVGEEDDQPDD